MSSKKTDPKEKRKYPRALVRALVDYESANTYLYDYSSTLGEGGIFIETEKPLSVGSTLTLRFTLPGIDRVFQIAGNVVWIREKGKSQDPDWPKALSSGMGIEFTDLDDADRKILRSYAEEHPKE